MSTLRIGSLFTGYGGLDMAVEAVFGGELEWYSEIEPAACKILEAHTSPDVPNLGDIKKIDWSTVEPVDILTGGYPCQPFSSAGLRKGTEDERHLWPYVREAIRHLRPSIVILENVRGHLTLGFDTVLGEMASVGYDARWGIVRASDAGACHQRARVFIVATPADTEHHGRDGSSIGRGIGPSQDQGWLLQLEGRASAPSSDADGRRFQTSHQKIGSVSVAHPAGGDTSVADTESNKQREPAESGSVRTELGDGADAGTIRLDWGRYGTAVRRWEQLTRTAPNPTILGKNGKPRLNPVFVEWMMGLPEGHVTGRGLRHAQELKMLGNGVVPQQAELAIRTLLNVNTEA